MVSNKIKMIEKLLYQLNRKPKLLKIKNFKLINKKQL